MSTVQQIVANTATYGGSSTAVAFGLSASEWSVIGVIGGLVIAAVGLAMNWYFKHQHLALARRRRLLDESEERDE